MYNMLTLGPSVKSASLSTRKEMEGVMRRIENEDKSKWPHGLNIDEHDDVFLIRSASTGTPAGFVGWQERNVNGARVGYYTVGILPEYRNQGLAKTKVAELINLKRASVDRVEAFIVAGNKPSIALAESLNIPVVHTPPNTATSVKSAGFLKSMLRNPAFQRAAAALDNSALQHTAGALGTSAFWDWQQSADRNIPFVEGEWDKVRAGMVLMNAALGGLGVNRLRKGDVVGGIGAQIVAPLSKEVLMNVLPAAHKLPGTMDKLNGKLTEQDEALKLMPAALLGSSVLGSAGLAAALLGRSKPVVDPYAAGKVSLRLPTKDPNDHETSIELPIQNFNLPGSTMQHLRRDTRRKLREEGSERTWRRGAGGRAATRYTEADEEGEDESELDAVRKEFKKVAAALGGSAPKIGPAAAQQASNDGKSEAKDPIEVAREARMNTPIGEPIPSMPVSPEGDPAAQQQQQQLQQQSQQLEQAKSQYADMVHKQQLAQIQETAKRTEQQLAETQSRLDRESAERQQETEKLRAENDSLKQQTATDSLRMQTLQAKAEMDKASYSAKPDTSALPGLLTTRVDNLSARISKLRNSAMTKLARIEEDVVWEKQAYAVVPPVSTTTTPTATAPTTPTATTPPAPVKPKHIPHVDTRHLDMPNLEGQNAARVQRMADIKKMSDPAARKAALIQELHRDRLEAGRSERKSGDIMHVTGDVRTGSAWRDWYQNRTVNTHGGTDWSKAHPKTMADHWAKLKYNTVMGAMTPFDFLGGTFANLVNNGVRLGASGMQTAQAYKDAVVDQRIANNKSTYADGTAGWMGQIWNHNHSDAASNDAWKTYAGNTWDLAKSVPGNVTDAALTLSTAGGAGLGLQGLKSTLALAGAGMGLDAMGLGQADAANTGTTQPVNIYNLNKRLGIANPATMASNQARMNGQPAAPNGTYDPYAAYRSRNRSYMPQIYQTQGAIGPEYSAVKPFYDTNGYGYTPGYTGVQQNNFLHGLSSMGTGMLGWNQRDPNVMHSMDYTTR